jgi:hypothetical protein
MIPMRSLSLLDLDGNGEEFALIVGKTESSGRATGTTASVVVGRLGVPVVVSVPDESFAESAGQC